MAFAWAPITYGAEKDDNGVITKMLTIKVGESVDQGAIKASDEDWKYLTENGVVRDAEYPVDVSGGGTLESPREAVLREAQAKMAEAESLAMRVEGGEIPVGSEAVRSGAAPGRK